KVKVTSSNFKTFEGRFMEVGPKRYKMISSKDKGIINTEIKLRSPVTCAGPNNQICRVCYGALWNINRNIHAGLYSATETNESKTQLGLSARHALATNSANAEVVDEMGFLAHTNGWLFILSKSIDLKRYSLLISPADITSENEKA